MQLANSTFLDYNSYQSSTATLPTDGTAVPSGFTFNVGLVLDRANDPTALLSSDWGARQQQLQALSDSGTLWSTYGADPTKYNQILSDLNGMGIPTVDQVDPSNGYVSSPESRTIWVQVDAASFQTLFGTQILRGTNQSGQTVTYWNGNLSLSDTFLGTGGVKGLILDTSAFSTFMLPDPGNGTAVTLPTGPQSQGNSSTDRKRLTPAQIADAYNFPLAGGGQTGTIGLLEPGIGSALPSASPDFQALLAEYRQTVNAPGPGTAVTYDPGGIQVWNSDRGGERSLDVGVVAGADPQSNMVLYAGTGNSAMTAWQQAIWGKLDPALAIADPQVLSSSFSGFEIAPAPGSPFQWADQQLFVDAALSNITAVNDSGDGGSGVKIGNGQANTETNESSPYDLIVGGTSLSLTASATTDGTLANLMAQALDGDQGTIWSLVAGGLHTLPRTASADDWMVETVWNQYDLKNSTIKYLANETGAGGVDTSQPTPAYQVDFGLTPTSVDGGAPTGRGLPDVSADAGGNAFYITPQPDMTGTTNSGGTSASTPLWAALVAQINAVFQDQGLPSLGYMNDLLYTADVIHPASFNDVTIGNNTSSFVLGGPIGASDGTTTTPVTPTGLGYSAGPGYDLTTGLGTPNGTELARTLTEIAHAQMSFSSVPDVLESDGSGGWQSGANQSLLFQTSSASPVDVSLSAGSDTTGYSSDASGAFAWTSQFAEQTLQPDFDPSLVTMFDGQSQGTVVQQTVAAGNAVSVGVDRAAADTPQATLSTPFGFADFTAGDGSVRVAQSVAVAETAGGQNDQDAVIRLRQGGFANLSLEFYRVDDYEGTVAGLAPGSAGYTAAADARAYQVLGGGTQVSGPGYGQYGQGEITGVNAGDLVAMKLTNTLLQTTFFAFGQANPDGAAHMWNYGANVWGWEDMLGGGDHDYNDLVVQIDFTSAAGRGLLM